MNEKPQRSLWRDGFVERLSVRAAAIDELISDAFEPLNQHPHGGADLTARRFAAWRRSAAAGDETLFARRLARDGLSIAKLQERFAAVRRRAGMAPPAWVDDAIWVGAALQSPHEGKDQSAEPSTGRSAAPLPFEHLFTPVVAQAESRLWSGLDARIGDRLSETARAELRRCLLAQLSELFAAAVYERFAKAPDAAAGTAQRGSTARYDQFVAAMKADGFRVLFEDKPVLLRLIASVTRQWIDTSREFVRRLDADLAILHRDILQSDGNGRVTRIESDLSDPHNGGYAVLIVSFADGERVVYKPKDLRLDVAWHDLIERLNAAKNSPVALKAARAIARDGYGWSEFIAHTGCVDAAAAARFYRRAGAWLALLHIFAATDMHQENMIAAGDHPVPVDLETILQPSPDELKVQDAEGQAFDAALDIVGNSIMTVGLLPAYGRSADNKVFAMGGMTANWGARTVIAWNDINSDAMRPAKAKQPGETNTNLPHIDGRYARFADHVDDFVAGFAGYAKFLGQWSGNPDALFGDFAGLPVRKVIRPTRFYYMLLQRLKNHRSMDDGAIWSAQADFVARLSEWDKDSDPLWPLHRAERSALLALNVPHFLSPSDGREIFDAAGITARTEASPGLDRARARLQNLDERETAWQIEVIRENTNSPARAAAEAAAAEQAAADLTPLAPAAPSKEIFLAEADGIAAEISRYAIRRGPGAAWIGLDWLGDSEVFQLVCLGPDLYNGTTGIGVFLAAHAAVTACKPSGELALAALSYLRKNLKSRNAARLARSLGIGGATGLGSVVYGFALIAKSLNDDELLADAQAATKLFSDELIAADKQLDVMGGAAGAILALIRLYRDTKSGDVLGRAEKCGEHLLAQSRLGGEGHRTWVGQGSGTVGLNGMSHGAAGFAYALAALAAVTGREDFAKAAAECIAFENSSYDAERRNWPDLRSGEPHWPCQWCHGAPGIGLARMATLRRGGGDAGLLTADIANAVAGVEQNRATPVDTLCCGTLGGVEFFCAAGGALGRSDLADLAAHRLMAVLERARTAGDYRWNSGKRQFNLGLFRGLAGIGYTLLRRIDSALPNVLIWE
jgi:type 2 lantibiotic biosynthesis protein LanM